MPSFKTLKAKEQDMRYNHQHDLNFEMPHLNFNGMLWFRDDDVLVDNSLHSVLTVYQPLYDPRDFNDIKLCFDIDDPALIRLYHPNVPTYMHTDIDTIHKQELKTDPNNSELYSFTAKKHKKSSIKVTTSEKHKIQVTECHLPFYVSSEQFSNIDNTGGEAEKHYRKIRVKVSERISDTCSYIFWKILIEGETTHLQSKRRAVRNQFEEAEERFIEEDSDDWTEEEIVSDEEEEDEYMEEVIEEEVSEELSVSSVSDEDFAQEETVSDEDFAQEENVSDEEQFSQEENVSDEEQFFDVDEHEQAKEIVPFVSILPCKRQATYDGPVEQDELEPSEPDTKRVKVNDLKDHDSDL